MLRLSLPLSTDFGNANSLTRGLPMHPSRSHRRALASFMRRSRMTAFHLLRKFKHYPFAVLVHRRKGRETRRPYRCVTFWLEQQKELN